MTLREEYAAGLTAMGYNRDTDYASRRYERWAKPGKPEFVYLGKSGAVRIGKTVTGSRPMSSAGKAKLAGRAKG